MARAPIRPLIVQKGTQVFLERGYSGSAVQDITAAAEVPKGSFYNHFESKEAFGAEVLQEFFADLQRTISMTLEATGVPPLRRLQNYFAAIIEILDGQDYVYGCLIGNFSVELSPLSDVVRTELLRIFEQWVKPFQKCIIEGQETGAIRGDLAPDLLADFLLASWQGAIMRMKIERNRGPLDQFLTVVFDALLTPSKNEIS
ncbi:TetR/AcrR family transcriptional regulator [Rhodococcus tibetensis]|uniref:TetR/AcrR family transcriptional regulator n=1 Tax=Rhodococcus tibetensis TaxID=2965064 RepID=A0ABT1QKE0_9NOCA|nr:TetR/AcrR family transcriptional regulator [Rhodococcus sp. FXJ9.536]MCQ4122113.1 TetR/AcrR family transcriptional regulator [Rhodococcus sp. FXJ9.536]